MFWVYILGCFDGCLYVGITNNLLRRFYEHQKGVHPGSFTYKRRPIQLLYVESFDDVRDAIKREKQLKRWSRKKKEALIAGDDENLKRFSKKIFHHSPCQPE